MPRPTPLSAASQGPTTDDRFDDLVEEVTQRLEAGESVDPGQYLHLGSELRERLRRLLPTLKALASLQSDRGSGPRSSWTAIVPPESLAKDLGDFQLGQELGRGGMGIVFAAEQRSLARRVAVKVLPWASLLSEIALDRFRTEVRAAASLTHEHIVPVYAVGCERGVHYYAMKLIDGCSLAEVIRERQESGVRSQASGATDPQSQFPNPKSPADDTLSLAAQITAAVNSESDWYRSIARLGVQAARALAHAHAQGVVHRDIKPSNLLLGKSGRLWLSDFGLARLEADAGLTRTGDLLGTLRYMSPEQALGQSSDLDARADIYSLGATLYECLTLQPAIRASTRTEILRQARDPRIATLRSHDPHVPEGLERIVLKCLRADPADRYATAAALAEDLERFLQGQSVRAALPGPYRRARQWATRHPTAMLVALAALAVTAAFSLVLAFFLWTADVRLRGPPNVRGSPPLASASSPLLDSNASSESPLMPRANVRSAKSTSSSQNRRLFFEPLERRTMLAADISLGGDPPSLSISDAAATEGSATYLGNFSSTAGGLYNPAMMTYGPDGHLYVATTIETNPPGSPQRFGVLRFDATTGAMLPAPGKQGAEFVSPGAGGINDIRSIAFGPDGKLYVVSELTSSVLRFDGVTGEPAGVSGQTGDADFIAPGIGGLDQPRGMLFHTDGFLYVTSVGINSGPGLDSVLRYNATTGAPAGISEQPDDAVFIVSGSGGLDNPSAIVFENEKFYVVSTRPTTSNSVLEYEVDGDFIRAFVPTGSGGLAGPADLIFRDGYLYVSSWTNNKVLRYNGISGAFVDEVASGDGLVTPLGLLFDSSGNLLVSSRDTDEIRRYEVHVRAAFTVSLSSPSESQVTVDYATANGSADAGDFKAASGTITFAPGQTSRTILVQTVNDSAIELNETFSVVLSAAAGGVIVDDTGIGTIIDNDTKFYVVDDGTTNRTFEYGSFADGSGVAGAAGESYVLPAGNGAPRGAASTAAGEKVWVVDANKNIYVYGSAGNLLGSWTATATGLSQPEGIATNGTDIWIVDASADKVFKYAGAASRLSGTQNSPNNASFKLNNSNKDARDIVTDGTHLWVVNNSSTDKVFKYALSGSLAGSWTITGGGGSPTGITLDPASPSHLWIVDNTTDLVSQYDGATGRTTGSQGASASFALASGNSNPQGIADPPVTGSPAIPSSSATPIEPQPFFAVDLLVGGVGSLWRNKTPDDRWTMPAKDSRPPEVYHPKVVDLALESYLHDADEGDSAEDDDEAEEDGEGENLLLVR